LDPHRNLRIRHSAGAISSRSLFIDVSCKKSSFEAVFSDFKAIHHLIPCLHCSSASRRRACPSQKFLRLQTCAELEFEVITLFTLPDA
jgi:hypothetical protein